MADDSTSTAWHVNDDEIDHQYAQMIANSIGDPKMTREEFVVMLERTRAYYEQANLEYGFHKLASGLPPTIDQLVNEAESYMHVMRPNVMQRWSKVEEKLGLSVMGEAEDRPMTTADNMRFKTRCVTNHMMGTVQAYLEEYHSTLAETIHLPELVQKTKDASSVEEEYRARKMKRSERLTTEKALAVNQVANALGAIHKDITEALDVEKVTEQILKDFPLEKPRKRDVPIDSGFKVAFPHTYDMVESLRMRHQVQKLIRKLEKIVAENVPQPGPSAAIECQELINLFPQATGTYLFSEALNRVMKDPHAIRGNEVIEQLITSLKQYDARIHESFSLEHLTNAYAKDRTAKSFVEPLNDGWVEPYAEGKNTLEIIQAARFADVAKNLETTIRLREGQLVKAYDEPGKSNSMTHVNPFSNLSDEELRATFIEKVHTFCDYASNHTPRKQLFERNFTSIVTMAEELARRAFVEEPLYDHMLPTTLLGEIGLDKDDIPGWPNPTYKLLVSVFDIIGYRYKSDGHIEVTEAIDKLKELMDTPLFKKSVLEHYKPKTERTID